MNFTFAIVWCLCWFSGSSMCTASQQEIGESCRSGSIEGVCISQSECLKIYVGAELAETCGLQQDGTPIVCCTAPPTETQSSERDYETTRNIDPYDVSVGNSVIANETETRAYHGGRRKTTILNKVTPNKVSSHKRTDLSGHEFSSDRISYDNRPLHSFLDNGDTRSVSNNIFSSNKPTHTQTHIQPVSYEPHSRPNYETVTFTRAGNTGKSGFDIQGIDESSVFFPGYNNAQHRPNNEQQNTIPIIDSSSDGDWNTNIRPNSRPNKNTRPNNGNSYSYPSVGSNRPNGATNGNTYRPSNGASSHKPTNNGSTNNHRTTTSDGSIWGSTSRVISTRAPTINTGGGSSLIGDSNTHTEGSTSHTGGWPTSSLQLKRISYQKCLEYTRNVTSTISAIPLAINSHATSHKVSTCKFTAATLIVGGEKAKLGVYPHMAALAYKVGSAYEYNCGATLISDEYVLTAAHCTHTSTGNPVHVRLGDLNLERDDDGARPQTINIASVITHPHYKPPQLYNDIALIRLARKVSFHEDLRPACLHSRRPIPSNSVVATGWGSTNYGEVSSDDLLQVKLDIIDNNKCNNLYGTDYQKLVNGITATMLCAGELTGKKDTCQGDSGGPLQIQDHNNLCIHYVVGITSFGKSCAAVNTPGIYTRVSEYVSWIESIVWKY